ncbi:hypothetical protein HMPREF1584_00914 [Gardnerella vaginalis JCP8481A]|nr:hypothetical protein HMPREF1584_00914 [Gardnerella vaginalis JCP8481A]
MPSEEMNFLFHEEGIFVMFCYFVIDVTNNVHSCWACCLC